LRLKILKKLKTSSLNSEFTGSSKKSVYQRFQKLYCYFSCFTLIWFGSCVN